jgi:hypothetical protein
MSPKKLDILEVIPKTLRIIFGAYDFALVQMLS